VGSSAHAQTVQANYTAVITSVEDPFNVFNNTIVVGGAVQGSFSYVPSQLTLFNSGANSTFYVSPFPNDSTFSANIGGVALSAFPSTLLGVGVHCTDGVCFAC